MIDLQSAQIPIDPTCSVVCADFCGFRRFWRTRRGLDGQLISRIDRDRQTKRGASAVVDTCAHQSEVYCNLW